LKNRKSKEKTRAKLADSTSSLVISLTYMLTICWVVPIAPMILTWSLDFSLASFMITWAAGFPFLSLAWYYLLRHRKV